MSVDYHLKLDGIQGEDQDANHKNEIQVLSFSWGAAQTSSVAGTGGSGAGKVHLSEFNIMTHFDKATPTSLKSICAGTHIKTGTFTAVKAGAGGKPYLQIDFQEMFVASLQVSGSTENPTVSIGFTYNQIKVDYSAQNEQGNITSTGAVTYNTKTNTLS